MQPVEEGKYILKGNKEFLQKNIPALTIIPWLIILLWVIYQTIGQFIPWGFPLYTEKSHKSSPSGSYTITAYSSDYGGGVAPYGDHLLLSGPSKLPNSGTVIFSGYCNKRPEYSWVSEYKIEIGCENSNPDPIRMVVQTIDGITIEVKN